jgi:hypothetical protein
MSASFPASRVSRSTTGTAVNGSQGEREGRKTLRQRLTSGLNREAIRKPRRCLRQSSVRR